MLLPLSLLLLWLAHLDSALANLAGTFADGGNTKISVMMMFMGNSKKVYFLDKAEGNDAQVNGHPAWGAVWDIDTHETTVMDVATNVFCASGMHLPNGSFVTFGGNGAIGPGGNIGSIKNSNGVSGSWDATYKDFDGATSIRVLNPCDDSDNFDSPDCQWFDQPEVLAMQRKRWYSAAEPRGDGTIAIIGGFVNGGYINRNFPNTNPEDPTMGGASEPTYEFFPPNGQTPQQMAFLAKTAGLNAYAHTFLLASGNMFLQANFSTVIWNPDTNAETDLPDMPNKVVRVYPASGGVAMLPLTPENNYAQTILFCGGMSDMPDEAWGNYGHPSANPWEFRASADCQRITPEPADDSAPVYTKDDDMPEGRTMGQFIILPTGKLLMVNGGSNGTAGYADTTGQTPNKADMPFTMSLASGPVGTPAIYDPDAPAGSRWSNAGLSTSSIARLYHSSALLLPDASVLIAGSNPNVDVNLNAVFPTEYRAEIFYPPYFSANSRPVPSGIPDKLSYGGKAFNVSLPASSYLGDPTPAAQSATVALLRPGWTTHAMNMGQRYLKLNSTYTVNKDATITLHVAQLPPNANLFQPGPAFVFVVVNGIPSNGTQVLVGSGRIEVQPTHLVTRLPDSVTETVTGSANGSAPTNAKGTNLTPIIAGAVGGAVVLGIIAVGAVLFMGRKRKQASHNARVLEPRVSYGPNNSSATLVPSGWYDPPPMRGYSDMSSKAGVGEEYDPYRAEPLYPNRKGY
ncbi:glyoxal oxidase N-terminus-domain-containing protein [Mycena rebaudengoi]|nr:glyoxal oxidase N-terminus-domain-containing protein [Mycena rebaudengoi]